VPRKNLHPKELHIKNFIPLELRAKINSSGPRFFPFWNSKGDWVNRMVLSSAAPLATGNRQLTTDLSKITEPDYGPFCPQQGIKDTTPLVMSIQICAPLSVKQVT
jgi:hypothetical protein